MRLWQAIMAGLQVFSGGSILTDLFPKTYVAFLVLFTAALQAGTIMYMKADQRVPVMRAPNSHRLRKQPESYDEGPRHARGD